MDLTFQPFVYGLVDPAEPKHVRYVGMAGVRASRPYAHAKHARKLTATPTWQVRWIRKIQAEGREPAVLILEQLSAGTSRKLLGFVESCYIKSLREIGHKLTNVTDGGDGGCREQPVKTRVKISASLKGRKKSEETKALLRAAWTDERRAAVRAARLGISTPGRVQTEEEKQKRAISLLQHYAEHPDERVVTQETRDRIAKTLTGYKHTHEARANMGASHIGSKRTAEARANMSAWQIGKPKSEDCKRKIAETLTGRKQSFETCEKRSVSVKAAKSTPEARLDASIKAKAAWARRKSKGGA